MIITNLIAKYERIGNRAVPHQLDDDRIYDSFGKDPGIMHY